MTTTDRIDAGWARIAAAMTDRERHMSDWSFFSGGHASPKARGYLRALLARSTDAELVADLRAFFNDRLATGDVIARPWVSAAIRALGG